MQVGKHIGIVAISAEGAALCYRTICAEGAELLGPYHHPEITMHTYPLIAYQRHIDAGGWEEVGRVMLLSAQKLAEAGAEILICPDNTVHEGLDLVRQDSPLPWLHIAEEVAVLGAERGYGCVGVLGTRWLMEGTVYSAAFATKGIEGEIPEAEDRGRIHDAILDELIYGRLEASTREYFQRVIRGLKERGCDAVVLGCTEIPLLIDDSDSALPTLDSTRILARAALREALRDLSS